MGAKQYFSLPAAARELGVSTDVLRRQYRSGFIPAIKTPGGQPRFTAETIDAIKETGWPQATQSQNLTEGTNERTAQLPEEAGGGDQFFDPFECAEINQEELDFPMQNEAPHFHPESTEHRRRLELFRFHQKWIEEACRFLPAWLTHDQVAEVSRQIEMEVKKRKPEDELWMLSVCKEIVRSIVLPLNRQWEMAQARATALNQLLAKIPYDATDREKVRVRALARAALQQASESGDCEELFDAAWQAAAPVLAEVELRRQREKLRAWAMQKLPLTANEEERREAKAAIHRVLEQTNGQRDEAILRSSVEVAMTPILASIPIRINEERRRQRVAGLLDSAKIEIGTYLNTLYCKGELDHEAVCDWEWHRELERIVIAELQEELSGDETSVELTEYVRDTLEQELEEWEEDEL